LQPREILVVAPADLDVEEVRNILRLEGETGPLEIVFGDNVPLAYGLLSRLQPGHVIADVEWLSRTPAGLQVMAMLRARICAGLRVSWRRPGPSRDASAPQPRLAPGILGNRLGSKR
jgi:hypothetical protein